MTRDEVVRLLNLLLKLSAQPWWQKPENREVVDGLRHAIETWWEHIAVGTTK